MLGIHHILFGWTGAVVLDSLTHVTGPAWLSHPAATTAGLPAEKLAFYAAVGLGALLPDIDEQSSLVGRCCGILSKEIQHFVGHRRFFHSLLGLLPWALLSLGFYLLAVYLLAQHSMSMPAEIVQACKISFVGLLFGCLMHLAADALTKEGVPLFWPYQVYIGFPPNPRWRIRTGHLGELLIVYGLIALVAVLGLVHYVSI